MNFQPEDILYTVVEVGPDRWIVISESGHCSTRPCSWKFAVACICRWTEPWS